MSAPGHLVESFETKIKSLKHLFISFEKEKDLQLYSFISLRCCLSEEQNYFIGLFVLSTNSNYTDLHRICMKIYTKKGDTGETALFGGSTTEKNDIRIHAYGTVDELNSVVGMTLSYKISDIGNTILAQVQNDLFVVGATLATPDPEKSRIEQVGDNEVKGLEQWIDTLEEDLAPLKSFILPGGGGAGATLHFARTVCRRAERETVQLSEAEDIPAEVIIYLNRLSDLLFVLARYENKQQGKKETPWIPEK